MSVTSPWSVDWLLEFSHWARCFHKKFGLDQGLRRAQTRPSAAWHCWTSARSSDTTLRLWRRRLCIQAAALPVHSPLPYFGVTAWGGTALLDGTSKNTQTLWTHLYVWETLRGVANVPRVELEKFLSLAQLQRWQASPEILPAVWCRGLHRQEF